MFDKYETWQYRDDHNCWDFVREFLIEKGVPEEDVPKYGIAPSNKKAMTAAAKEVMPAFIEGDPAQNAIACHFYGNAIYHVGVVDRGFVRHTGKKTGTRKDPIQKFCEMGNTKFYLHKLWRR